MQTGHSLYALAWSPDSESVVVGAGRDLAVKGVQVRTYLVSINQDLVTYKARLVIVR